MTRALDPATIELDGIQLIEASAGTGKTYTITQLYLRLLVEKKIDSDKILVVTFTDAATAELRDRIRPDAKGVVEKLHAQGVETIVMLTGDNERTARAVAAEVGIDEVRAELLPEDKVTAIEELVEIHDMVAMIGDGVNDAPALA